MRVRSSTTAGARDRRGQAETPARATRADFAWEFLRRNPRYRAIAARAATGAPDSDAAAPWGLQFLADPDLPAGVADVFWRPEIAPAQVVILQPDVAGGLAHLPGGNVALQRHGEDGLHLRLQTGVQALVRGGDLSRPLAVILPLTGQFSAHLRSAEAWRRAMAGAAGPMDDLTAQQRTRLRRSLQALDGALEHRSYREIAVELFGPDAVAREPWKTSSVRDTTLRLVRSGRALMEGAYLKLLRG